MVGTGIPFMVLQNRRMGNIVDYYKGEDTIEPPRYSLARITFGPTPNGVGLALTF